MTFRSSLTLIMPQKGGGGGHGDAHRIIWGGHDDVINRMTLQFWIISLVTVPNNIFPHILKAEEPEFLDIVASISSTTFCESVIPRCL